MNDYISRESALNFMCDACKNATCPKLNGGVCSSYNKLATLPGANVRENKIGKCTDQARYFFCSVCGYGVQDVFEGAYSEENPVYVFEKGETWKYCPNCGAKIEEPTNADRIRAMTDKELAYIMYGLNQRKTPEEWLDYLKATQAEILLRGQKNELV